MHLVVGATGFLGGEICRQLIEKGKPVRAMVRRTSNPETVARLKGYGAEIVEGDLKNRASLDKACRGVEAVITTVATTLSRQADDSIKKTDLGGQKSLVDATREAGAGHFVYISVPGSISAEGSFIAARRAVEEHLKGSGMTYTILRPGLFMEIWLSPHPRIGFDYPNARARVFGTGEGKHSWISLGDVAQFAVASLDHPAGHNAVIELGSQWLSHMEIIRIFEEVGDRQFDVEHVPHEAIEEQLNAPDEYAQTFGYLMLGIAKGESQSLVDEALLRKFPVQLTPVRDYVQRVLEPVRA